MLTKLFFLITPLSSFGRAFLYIIGGTLFVMVGLLVTRLLSPNRPNPEKLSSYECGEDPIGDSGLQFNIRFYVVALIFLIFEVEILFLFPWATVFAKPELIAEIPSWGIFALIEMLIFVAILLLGLAYVWIKKDLAWIKPKPIQATAPSTIPKEKYQTINQKYGGRRSPRNKASELTR